MRFGIFNLSHTPYHEIARYFQNAEQLGFDSAWVDDDLLVPEYADLEPWTLLGALARDTSRMQLGTMVTAITFRHPTFLAAQVATLDQVSDGRAALGLGSGGPPHPYGAFGHADWGPRERAERLEEQAAILDPLLRGESVDFSGRHYSVVRASMPNAVQKPRPPFIIAAHGDRALRTVARHADGWNSLGGLLFPEPDPPRTLTLAEAVAETRRLSERLDRFCEELGRDPATLRRSVQAIKPNPEPFSSLDAFDAYVGAYEEIGIDELILYWPPVDLLFERRGPVPARRQAIFERIAAERIAARKTN
jgi:alkanesulfonate monooxygenase SsuD/methylene tetrahydromethanopterin reductase-like flavin-dependent oxidoreductase (luciferase family)